MSAPPPSLGAKAFGQALKARAVDPAGRRWVYLSHDQLHEDLNPLRELPPEHLALVYVESPWAWRLRPYHRQKLAMLVANGRQFALDLAAKGWAVRHEVALGPWAPQLEAIARDLGSPLEGVVPAEREQRVALGPAVASGHLHLHPHRGWLTGAGLFREACGDRPPYRMDAFYRRARQASGLLLDPRGGPLGGKWSFDSENRQPWKGQVPAPAFPRFRHDEVTQEVLEGLATHFTEHPGALDPDALPSTLADAEALWAWAMAECLPHFGPYEDAMSERSWGLFHTRISPLLNLHRLLPERVVREVASAEALPLASREGFVRQILGWREFVRHVHEATDGFRSALPEGLPSLAPGAEPGDGGFAGWAGKAWPLPAEAPEGGARPDFLGAQNPLPAAFWGQPSGARCLDEVVKGVWATGYSHHITRLMVLSNWAQLLDVDPRQLSDWFWVAYVDAYDWVVEPNVLGMSTHAAGPLMTTKPYVSGAAYLAKMSDFCGPCAFDPKKNCPLTAMYWAYLARHEARLGQNHRLAMPYAAWRKRSVAQREQDAATAQAVQASLAAGRRLTPPGPQLQALPLGLP